MLNGDNIFKIQADVIRSIADGGPCIIVGRCADYILRDHPHLIRLFLCADEEHRIENLMKRDGMTEEDLDEVIDQYDTEMEIILDANPDFDASDIDFTYTASVYSSSELAQLNKLYKKAGLTCTSAVQLDVVATSDALPSDYTFILTLVKVDDDWWTDIENTVF